MVYNSSEELKKSSKGHPDKQSTKYSEVDAFKAQDLEVTMIKADKSDQGYFKGRRDMEFKQFKDSKRKQFSVETIHKVYLNLRKVHGCLCEFISCHSKIDGYDHQAVHARKCLRK